MTISLWVALVFMFAGMGGITVAFAAMMFWQRIEFRKREDRLYGKLRTAEEQIGQLQGQVGTLMRVIQQAQRNGDISISAEGDLNIGEFVGQNKTTDTRTTHTNYAPQRWVDPDERRD